MRRYVRRAVTVESSIEEHAAFVAVGDRGGCSRSRHSDHPHHPVSVQELILFSWRLRLHALSPRKAGGIFCPTSPTMSSVGQEKDEKDAGSVENAVAPADSLQLENKRAFTTTRPELWAFYVYYIVRTRRREGVGQG